MQENMIYAGGTCVMQEGHDLCMRHRCDAGGTLFMLEVHDRCGGT